MPETTSKKFIIFEGRKYPLVRETSGTWRLRSRSSSHSVNHGLGTTDLATAKRLAKSYLESHQGGQEKKVEGNLEEVVKAYLEMPKRVSERAATDNVQRLRKIVLAARKKTLKEFALSESLPRLWADFMATRLPDGRLDLATRRPENSAINSAVKAASSIFIKRLHPSYAERGLSIPADATTVQWLPTMDLPRPVADDGALVKWWNDLPVGSDEWLAVGLARFAGLRSSEISALTPEWIVESKGSFFVALQDRPEQGFLKKTRKAYRAMILQPKLAEVILGMASGERVVHPKELGREEWMIRHLPELVRRFSPSSKKPLHRLRGLYADEVAAITEDAVAARQEAVREAAQNLGHTTTATTTEHYLSEA